MAEDKTGVRVVAEPWEQAAACSNVANCSGLYSVLGILAGEGPPARLFEASDVTADMLGKRADTAATEVGTAGWLLRTSTRL